MNHTLTNGLRLLALLASTGRAHGVTELAGMTGLPKSHVHRLLQSLLAARLLEKDSRSRYRIGVGTLRLGHELLRNIPVRQSALPEMIALAREQALHLTLALPYGDEAISIAHVTHNGEVRGAAESLGSVLSAHASASGKLFLAHKTEDELEEILPRLHYTILGPNTHEDAVSLREDLQQIYARGYSINQCEGGRDVLSFALPIRNSESFVFAALGAHTKAEVDFTARDIVRLADVLSQTIQRIETTIHKEYQNDYAD